MAQCHCEGYCSQGIGARKRPCHLCSVPHRALLRGRNEGQVRPGNLGGEWDWPALAFTPPQPRASVPCFSRVWAEPFGRELHLSPLGRSVLRGAAARTNRQLVKVLSPWEGCGILNSPGSACLPAIHSEELTTLRRIGSRATHLCVWLAVRPSRPTSFTELEMSAFGA